MSGTITNLLIIALIFIDLPFLILGQRSSSADLMVPAECF